VKWWEVSPQGVQELFGSPWCFFALQIHHHPSRQTWIATPPYFIACTAEIAQESPKVTGFEDPFFEAPKTN
jgi:hypothetical protein